MKADRQDHINWNIAVKIFLLLGFALFFILTILLGSVSLYVHPRNIPYMIFAAVFMVALAVLLAKDLFSPAKHASFSLFFYVVPLLMAFLVPAQSFDSNTVTIGDVQLLGDNSMNISAEEEETEESQEEETPSADTDDTEEKKDNLLEQQGNTGYTEDDLLVEDGVIIMNSDTFYGCLETIYADVDTYLGREIEVVGFVLKDNAGLEDGEFVCARLVMVCCAADMVPVGFLCRYDDAAELEEDSWLTVRGFINTTDYEGEMIPCIDAVRAVVTDAPDDAYIYPY